MKGPMTCSRRGPVRGILSVPGDKSISHRSLLFGALAVGETRVTGLLDAEDVHSTRKAGERLGAVVTREGAEIVVTPPEKLQEPDDVIDCGNSGTSLRLLAGVDAQRVEALPLFVHARRFTTWPTRGRTVSAPRRCCRRAPNSPAWPKSWT